MTWPTIFANLAAGNQPLSLFDQMFAQVAQLVAIPCTASGANTIVLTPIGNAPTLTAYNNFQMFRFKAAGNSTAAVSVQFTGLSALPVYQKDGVTQCAAGSIVGGQEYLVCFDQSRNANAGGFYLEDAAQPLAQGASPVWGPFTSLASAATTDLSTASTIAVLITGTATITSFGAGVNLAKVVRFAGSLLLTNNNTSLLLPGAANIQTQANDTLIALSDASGNWYVVAYSKRSGAPILTGTSGLALVGQGAGVDSAHAVLGVPGGGTGDTTLTAHGVLVGEAAAAIAATAAGATGVPLIGQGGSADPIFGTAVVAGGGTGATTLTAHGVLVGEGTGAIVATAVGNAGQVLTSNGAGNDPTFQALPGTTPITPTVQYLTSSQTVTIPTGATKCAITLGGGGGGGGGGVATVCANGLGGPGGAAAVLTKYLSNLTPGNTLILTIGGGGAAGTSAPGAGGNGGDSTVASGTQTITTLTAGKGGGGAAATGAVGVPGGGGAALNGDLNMNGPTGTTISAAILALGPPLFGSATPQPAGGVAGKNAQNYGSPGSGGNSNVNTVGVAGGTGTQGFAIFEWYA